MDPSCCSVVVSYQPSPQPFIIDHQDTSVYDDQPPYCSLLRSVFGKVFLHANPSEILDRVKQVKIDSPTVLLIDLDSASDANDVIDTNEDDDDTIYTPSCSSSCSTASSSSAITDARIAGIRKLARELDTALAGDVPIIACSSSDSTSFMLDCIHAGAADYLLKPLRIDVIKTLFLKLHRCRPDSKMHETTHHDSSFLPSTFSENLMSTSSTLCPEDDLQHRIKEIYTKDNRFTQSVMEIYVNPFPPRVRFRGLSSDRATLLQHKVSSWDFNPFELSHDDLIHCSYLIFQQVLALPELSHLTITEDQLYDFIIDLSSSYHDGNPYHNFAHAVDVLQCLYYFLCRLGLLSFANGYTNHVADNVTQRPQDLLRPKDVFALLIAAIGHDAAHPGVNNMFLINSCAPLALLYNDRSVLECFHSMTLFQIIKKHGFDHIGGAPNSSDYQEFRKTVVTSILATDMSLHSEYVEKINTQGPRIVTRLNLNESEREKDRLLLCSALIKCADISNVTRPFLRAAKWAELLVQESVSQGDLERAMGLPIMPLNDRNKVVLEDTQIGFIRFVALGLFESISEILPEMSFTVDCIRDNLKRWENRKNATHDSGVASLSDEADASDPAVPLVVEAVGSKRRSNSLDYHSQAVEVFRKRLSLDTNRVGNDVRRRSSVGSSESFGQLPSMSAVALESYGHLANTDSQDDWQHHGTPERANHVLCQCCIQ